MAIQNIEGKREPWAERKRVDSASSVEEGETGDGTEVVRKEYGKEGGGRRGRGREREGGRKKSLIFLVYHLW